MHDARIGPARVASGVRAVSFNWPAVRAACAKRGATTNVECAVALGLSPRTLDRLRVDPEGGLLRIALHLRATTGIGLDDLFPADQHQLSEAV